MAKKMILMDPRWLELQRPVNYTPPDPISDNMRDLDHEMQQILTRNDLPIGDKARLYQKTLQRYLHRVDQFQNRPLGHVDIKTPAIDPVHKEPETEKPIIVPTSPVKTPQEPHSAKTIHKTYKLRRSKKTKIPTPVKWEALPRR